MSDPVPPAEPTADRALAQLPPTEGVLVCDPTGKPMVYWSTWAIDGPADRRRMMAALSEPTLRPASILNTPYPTEHIFMHPVELVDHKTGEVREHIRTVLIAPDGRTLAFVSSGVVRWVKWMVSIYGKPPWKPALPIVVRHVDLSEGRRTYALDVVEEPETPPAPKGKGGGRA